jgi:hypothetical protein
LWNRNRLRKGCFWPVRISARFTGISLGYLLNEAVVFRVILYDFVRWVEESCDILPFLDELTVFQLFGSCESIEEVVSDILELEIGSICSVRVSLVARMSIQKVGKLPRIFKRPDYSNDPYKKFKLLRMTRIYADYSYFAYSYNRALL